MRVHVAVAVLLLLGGCVTPQVDDVDPASGADAPPIAPPPAATTPEAPDAEEDASEGAPVSEAPAPLPQYLYRCAGSDEAATFRSRTPETSRSLVLRNELAASTTPCFEPLVDDAKLLEPFVAHHPTDRLVAAIGTNRAPTFVESAQRFADSGASSQCDLGIHVTTDGGATWRASRLPVPKSGAPDGAFQVSCAYDPALAFDARGVLHATAISAGDTPSRFVEAVGIGTYARTYYARSTDFGATWSEPLVLDDSGWHDRNWIAVHPTSGLVFAHWQRVGGGFVTQYAWSTDSGATWTATPADAALPCGQDGPPALSGDKVVFGCRAVDDGESALNVYSFDPAAGTAELVGTFEEPGFWPFIVPTARGEVALISSGNGDVLRWSADGGRNWSDARALREFVAGEWASVHAYWAAADAYGAVHLLVRVASPESTALGFGVWRSELRHLVLGPGGALVSETTLAEWEDTSPVSTPTGPTNPALAGNHYFGLEWHADKALVAFSARERTFVGAIIAVPP